MKKIIVFSILVMSFVSMEAFALRNANTRQAGVNPRAAAAGVAVVGKRAALSGSNGSATGTTILTGPAGANCSGVTNSGTTVENGHQSWYGNQVGGGATWICCAAGTSCYDHPQPQN